MKSCENPFTVSQIFTRQHINRSSYMHGETRVCHYARSRCERA
jgi:hypothetical protein